MKRNLRDIVELECASILKVFDQYLIDTNSAASDEPSKTKQLIEFLLDQGNILPKTIMKTLFTQESFSKIDHIYVSPFLYETYEDTTLSIPSQNISLSSNAKQSYTDKSPLSNDSYISDLMFLFEEINKVFFDFKYAPVLFEKRYFLLQSTMHELVMFLRGESEMANQVFVKQIIFKRFIPLLYALLSFESKSKSCDIWDLVIQVDKKMDCRELTTSINQVDETIKYQLDYVKKKYPRMDVEISKTKFKSFVCLGLTNKNLDLLLSTIFSHPSFTSFLRNDSALINKKIQHSIVSGLSLMQQYPFNLPLTQPLFTDNDISPSSPLF